MVCAGQVNTDNCMVSMGTTQKTVDHIAVFVYVPLHHSSSVSLLPASHCIHSIVVFILTYLLALIYHEQQQQSLLSPLFRIMVAV